MFPVGNGLKCEHSHKLLHWQMMRRGRWYWNSTCIRQCRGDLKTMTQCLTMLVPFVLSFAPAQAQQTQTQTLEPVTTFKVDVTSRTLRAINYRHRGGATSIDFVGTAIAPDGKGKSKVESKKGYIEIDASFSGLPPAHTIGQEYLTYVLWAITPEGRPKNLGEILVKDGRSSLNVTTNFQVFGLIVTAEPYFAVTQPSDVVVLENEVKPDTLGKFEYVDAKFELLKNGQYAGTGSAQPWMWSSKLPIELIEARNAIRIARMFGADKYAKETFDKAQTALNQAQNYQDTRAGNKPVSMMAREAVQRAEDARVISLQRQEEERLAMERQAAADREAKARAEQARAQAEAEAEARRRQQAEAARLQSEQQAAAARAQSERARLEADEAAKRAAQEREAAERAKADADAARAAAENTRKQAEAAQQAALAQQQQLALEAEKARQAAAEADRLRLQAESDKAQLRQQLRDQLNLVLETRDSARGLIVNMSDVLFDTAKYTLKPEARERLARVSGIVLAHPSLKLEVEGHTDSVGSDEYNQTLSNNRANAVRSYLLTQGLRTEQITAVGFGEGRPVATNDTAKGRQQNRRVEIVVSGEAIGGAATSPNN